MREASPTAVPLRRRARAIGLRVAWRALLALAAASLALAALLWVVFAGSAGRLADGVVVGGVDVGGMSPAAAVRLLEARSAEVAGVPVAFTAGDERWRLTPAQLGVEVDWTAAVEAARRQGEGFGPVRGLRRLHTRFFGVEIAPPTRVYDAALTYHVAAIAKELRREPRDAALRLQGLRPVVVPSQTGRALDEAAAEATMVRALASFARAPVGLPVRVEPPRVTGAELAPALRELRVAVSAPVRLALGETRWRLPRWRIAELLALPSGGRTSLAIAGPAAEAWLDRLAARVDRPSADARFEILPDGGVGLVPSSAGTKLDPVATAHALLEAAVSPTGRLAQVAVGTAAPELTTEKARSLGITRVLATYSTGYAGTADRIRNLQLAVAALDGARIAPGATFSFNERVGERTLERGYRSAPVIIDGEYEEGVGGGVSQVATTVFNAAWEAGLEIVQRAPHALYIARYQLGRDATVNYPELDLRFVNDTDGWIVLRAGAGGSGIWVGLLGGDTGRRVVSEPGPLVVTGPPRVERVPDPTLPIGETVIEEEGQPSRSVSVKRTVYGRDGKVIHAETWTTSYRSEKQVVRVGTKKPPPEETTPPKDETPPPPTATTPSETTPPPTTTAPTTTTPDPSTRP